jgi:hypothetical protein
MIHRLWAALKVLLSLALVTIIIMVAILSPKALSDPTFYGVVALFISLIILLWVRLEAFSSARQGAGIAICSLFAVGAVAILAGAWDYPRECRGRGALGCMAINWLFGIGGRWLAALPLVALATLVYIASVSNRRGSWIKRRSP